MPYIPHTKQDIQAMLDVMGVDAIETLFDEVPQALRTKSLEKVPAGLSEMAMTRLAETLSSKDANQHCFIGAGAYEHHIPAAVWALATRGEFYTAYTPYQAGEKFVTNRVWMGDVKEVDLGILESTPITIPRGNRKNLAANFELTRQLTAPLNKGDIVGTVFLQLDGEDIANYPLVTLQDVKEGGMFSRLVDYIKLQFNN